MKTPLNKLLSFVTLIAAADLTCHPAAAQIESPADKLIRQVSQTIESASTVRAEFEEVDSYPGSYKDLRQQGTIALEHPGELEINIHRFRRVSADKVWTASGNDTLAVSDGKTYWYAFLHPHSTQVRQAASTPATLKAALNAAAPLSGFFPSDTAFSLPSQGGSATLVGTRDWEGNTYRVIGYPVVTPGGPQISAEAYVGLDNVIHRLVYTSESPTGTTTKEWDLHNLVLNAPIPAARFVYTPPADVFPLNNEKRPPLLAAGSEAPDFTVYNAAGDPVKLSDYRGKTIILDFWATWCWPCNQSLAQTERIGRDYGSKGVVVLAVAIWDSKTGFDLWLSKNDYPSIRFAIDPRPQGSDSASSLYNVTVTPTAYIIDAQGKIVRSIVGFAGPSPDMEAAIKAALPTYTASR